MNTLAFILVAASAAWAVPAAAQSAGPTDMTPSGPFTGTLPTAEAPGMGAGVVIPGSGADVTVQDGQYGKGNAKLHALASQRRDDAIKLAAMAGRGATVPPEFAAKLRDALDGDIKLWIEEYRPSGGEARTMRKTWLVDTRSLSANQWAEQRAKWYAARDQWIAAHR